MVCQALSKVSDFSDANQLTDWLSWGQGVIHYGQEVEESWAETAGSLGIPAEPTEETSTSPGAKKYAEEAFQYFNALLGIKVSDSNPSWVNC
jgi:hypothetical protein